MIEPARAIPSADARARAAHAPRAATLRVVPPLAAARPLSAVRPAATTRRPIHVVVAIGMTAGLYALSLAGVTALQSATDAKLAADHAPAAGAVAQLKSTHDAMEGSLDRLAGAYAKVANGYQAITDGIVGHELALAALRRQVEAAAGSAAALSVPSLSRLPAVSGSAVTVRSRPVVNACTTASGKPC
jgi:hypothetical protein